MIQSSLRLRNVLFHSLNSHWVLVPGTFESSLKTLLRTFESKASASDVGKWLKLAVLLQQLWRICHYITTMLFDECLEFPHVFR